MAATTPTTKKQVQVLNRRSFEGGIVVYTVLSSNGHDEYCTTTVNGLATGCTCPNQHSAACYHKTGVEAIEAQRKPVHSCKLCGHDTKNDWRVCGLCMGE